MKKQIVETSGNKDVRFMQLDLSLMRNVRNFVKEFTVDYPKLHYLVNNAGMMGDVTGSWLTR